ncbi:MAG: hypothetical protein OXF30_01085 [Candidatus Saccharibacteria bacterium]|nr:hypothetical protein [Candidatus Saccharibacteria bacterium]
MFQFLDKNCQQLEAEYNQQLAQLDKNLASTKAEIISTNLEKIKIIDSPSTIKYIAEEIDDLEKQVSGIKVKQQTLISQKPVNI